MAIKIKPIQLGLPAKECNELFVRPIINDTQAIDCNTYYEVIACETTTTVDSEGKETVNESRIIMTNGNCPITPEQYVQWADDNTLIEDIVIAYLGLERL